MRTQPRLHAKVYCLPDRLVIGSSNASANGLGFGGADARGNIEANLFTMNKSVIADSIAWFEQKWSQAEPVDAGMADEAMPFWLNAQNNPIQTSEGSLLDAVKDNVVRYKSRDLFIALYPDEQPSAAAKRKYETVKSLIYSSAQLAQLDGILPYYQDDDGDFKVKPGITTVLDFVYKSKTRPPSFRNMWKVRDVNHVVPNASKNHPQARLILCDLVYQYQNLRLTKNNVAEIANRLLAYSRRTTSGTTQKKKVILGLLFG